MQAEPAASPKEQLRRVVNRCFNKSVDAVINGLRITNASSLAEQLSSARGSAELLRELLRRWVMQPTDTDDPTVTRARQHFGWKPNMGDFNGLRPEFLDAIYLLPPRNYAVIETLLPLLEHHRGWTAATPAPGLKRLLDVGTGTGLVMEILSEAGLTGEMLGIDPAPTLASHASKRFHGSKTIEITIERIEDFEHAAQFEMALCYMVLHHLNDGEYERALRRIYRNLVDGGLFVYTDKLCSGVDESGAPKGFDFTTGVQPIELDSGQEFEVQSAELNSVPPFQPHPASIQEYHRELKQAAELLSRTGFLIQSAKPLNERVILFVCRKPHEKVWNNFATKAESKFRSLGDKIELAAGHSPYSWTYDILKALYEDITGEPCPDTFVREANGFLRGIAYFSWEKASRLFLVRRAVPFDFHILSYSHVHEGWGSLGRMVADFERNTSRYVANAGYSCLTRDSVQRTLPFQGDIAHLNYEAAMAVPIYKGDQTEGYQLRGALLLFLAKPEYVPLHTGGPLQKKLVARFRDLNDLINRALDQQENLLEITDSSAVICDKWSALAKDRGDVVIGRLEIEYQGASTTSGVEVPNELSRVCSTVQALLSGGECFSVLDGRWLDSGKAIILVAARFGLSYEDIKERMLAAVGAAAENYPVRYVCSRLGSENDR